MLVHICCSVDSHFFLEQLTKDYPNEHIVAFFYDPNIHPYSEYRLRLYDVQYSCDILGIELIEGEYDYQTWLKLTKGFENEPEKQNRCTICFDRRLEVTAQEALKLNHHSFTTTLLMSPKKSQDKLNTIGQKLAKKYNLEFVFKDYRIKDGMHLQNKAVKTNKLYRQDYCGCMFALMQQREYQQRLSDELISPIGRQILPESIEYRLQLYKNRTSKSEIIKQRFLNFRLLSAKVVSQNKTIKSYFLCYSTLRNGYSKGKVTKIIQDVGYFNKDEIKIISLDYLNKKLNKNYKDITQLVYNPPLFEEELKLRDIVTNNNRYDLSAIIVLEQINENKLTIYCNSKVYEDTKEVILKCN